MANWKGVDAGKPALPSKQSNKKGEAKVSFKCEDAAPGKSGYKGVSNPAGAKASERKAIISASNIHDVKSDRKTSVGAGPKG